MRTQRTRYPDLWSTIAKIQKTLDLSDTDFSEYLELTLKDFQSHRRLGQSLKLRPMSLLADRLDLNLETLIFDSVDCQALAVRRHDSGHLQERYLVGAFSKRRTVLNFLDYLERYKGLSIRKRVDCAPKIGHLAS